MSELKILFADLETIPNLKLVHALPEVEVSGNLKTPAKFQEEIKLLEEEKQRAITAEKSIKAIETKIHKAHEGIISATRNIENNIAEQKKSAVKNMGLTPALNIICCAGWADNSGNVGHIMLENEDSEKELLLEWWELCANYDLFVTFNGRGFDMRCLLLHSMLHKIRPSVNISAGRYNKGNHVDLLPVLSGEAAFAKGKLDMYAKVFLNRGKTIGINGKDVWNWWLLGDKPYIAKYCEEDCTITRDLYYMAVESCLIEALSC